MIPIYKHEQAAGLAEKVQASASFSFASSVRLTDINLDDKSAVAKFGANPEQRDLYYLESVLTSIGWNANDDVFGKDQTWAARNTPVDKQFNYMHDESDIIGHLTSSRVVDFEGNLIANDTKLDELPDQFEIVVGGVLYKKWKDEELQERMNKLIAEIPEDKWFVSMECWFGDFDYALTAQDGTQHIITRNDDTSFLTKMLRAYGGNGEFDNHKLGRYLKDFAFSGNGLVTNPANKRSFIINTTANTKFTGQQTKNLEILNMADTTYSQAHVDALEAKLAEAQNAAKAAVEKEIQDLKDQNAKLVEDKNALASDLDNANKLSEEKDTKIQSLEASVTEVTEAKDALKTELDEIKAESVKVARISKLVEAGVSSEDAEAIATKFESANDEMFNEVVELNRAVSKKGDKKDDDEKKDKDAKADEVPTDDVDDAEANADDTDVEDANADDAAGLNDGEEDNTLANDLQGWLSAAVLPQNDTNEN